MYANNGTTLVIAHPNAAFVSEVDRQCKKIGWTVHAALGHDDARRLARSERPAVVVLAAEGDGQETGWLTCVKLNQEHRKLRVFLVDDTPSPERGQFTAFAGGLTLPARGGVAALIGNLGDFSGRAKAA